MVRTQIQLTDQQARRLRAEARAQGISVAEMIRRSVDRALAEEKIDRTRLYANAAKIIGRFPDRRGARDLAREHDRYLGDALE